MPSEPLEADILSLMWNVRLFRCLLDYASITGPPVTETMQNAPLQSPAVHDAAFERSQCIAIKYLLYLIQNE